MQENFEAMAEENAENQMENLGQEQAQTEYTEVEELEIQLKEEKEKFLRLFAEFENFRKRTTKERIELYKTANESLLLDLVPVLDDIDRASDQIEKAQDTELLKGVELIKHKLTETLKQKGLKKIEVEKGDAFDVDKHEAVTQIPASKPDEIGKIVDVIETGYQLGDKIIRFPKVVVGI